MFRRCLVAAMLTAALVGAVAVPAHAAPAAAAAPQVRISAGLGIYIGLYGSEIRVLGSALIGIGGGGAIVGCGGLAKLPAAPAKALAFICGAVGQPTFGTVRQWIIDFYNSGNFVDSQCYQAKVAGVWPRQQESFRSVGQEQCKVGFGA